MCLSTNFAFSGNQAEKKAVRSTVVGADGAALVMGDDGVGAVGCVLADDLIAHHGAAVAHADLAWLRFPYVTVRKHLAVKGAASIRACGGRQRSTDRSGGETAHVNRIRTSEAQGKKTQPGNQSDFNSSRGVEPMAIFLRLIF